MSGAAANVYGQGVTIVTQLVGVPILIGCWGLGGFGLWTMLMTIPLFLIASDFGYSAAAAGMMNKAVAHEDYQDALTSLHTALAMVGSIALAILMIAFVIFFFVNPGAHQGNLAQPFAGLSGADVAIAGRVLPFLLAYVSVSLLSGLVNAVYRVNGLYPIGVMLFETGRLIEQIAVMGVALLGGSLLFASVAMLCSRVIFTSLSATVMLRQTPWATLSRNRLTELTVPAIGAMLIPICIIAGTQGITIAVGLFLSPAIAGAFATVRVLYRMVVQIVGTLTRASVPDFSIAYARDDLPAQARIARLTVTALIIGATVGTGVILAVGPRFVHVWTGGKVDLPFYIYLVLFAHSFFGCIWNGLSNLLAGLNLHPRYIFQLLLWNLLAVAALFATIDRYGLLAAAIALATIDIFSFLSVVKVWRRVSPTKINLGRFSARRPAVVAPSQQRPRHTNVR